MPIPFFLTSSSTPLGQKKLRNVASWQANPTTLPSLTAMKQEMGWRPKAISVSLAQPSAKFSRTHAAILCFSAAKARRMWIPCSPSRSKTAQELLLTIRSRIFAAP